MVMLGGLCVLTSDLVPGKPKEPLNYAGGIPEYMRQLNQAVEKGFEGFTVQ